MSHLTRYASRPVREVLRMPGPAADELLQHAKAPRLVWSYREWLALLTRLEACEETVGEWMSFRE